MNDLGPLGLLAIAVGVAALFVLIGAIPVLLARNLITRRPAAAHLREWLLYVLSAALLIIACAGSYLLAKHRGISEYTVVRWANILTTTAIVFGSAAKKFWRLRTKWTFWVALGVLLVGHFAFLSRLHWQQAGYFWLPVVVGLPELALVVFVLGLTFDPDEKLRASARGAGATDNAMRGFLRKILAIAAVPGFVAGVYVFIASFFGLTLDKLGAGGFLLHLGIFALALPLVIVENRVKGLDPFYGKPRWAVRSIQALGLVCVVCFLGFLVLSHAASPEIVNGEYVLSDHGRIAGHITERDYLFLKGWELRLFASGWIFFYYSLMISWWFPKREETPWTVTMPE